LITEEVPHAVDHAGGPERNPGDLRQPDEDARHDAQREEVEPEQQENTAGRKARVEIALHPVVRGPMAIALHGFLVVRLLHIQEHAQPEHAVDAIDLRAVRVFRALALRVVLAMDGSPLLGVHPGGEPEPEAEEVRHDGVQLQGAVRLAAMQIDRDGRDRDMGQRERSED